MKTSPGSFEVDLFSEEVDSPDHPYADHFKELLESVAGEYQCRLVSFDVKKGTVFFSFDSDALTAEILDILDRNEEK